MPEIITCPDCEKKLRVPDHLLGKKVKCPGCGVMFVGKADSAPPEDEPPPPARKRATPPPEDRVEDKPRSGARRSVVPPPEDEDDRPRSRRRDYDEDEDDRPRARRRRDEDEDEDYPRSRRPDAYDDEDEDDDRGRARPRDVRDGWQKVRSGLNLAMISGWIEVAGIVTLTVVMIIGMIVVFAAASSAASNVPPQGGIRPGTNTPSDGAASAGIFAILMMCLTYGIFGLCMLAALILKLVGYGICMGAPSTRNSAVKVLGITAFSLSAGGVALWLISFLIAIASGSNTVMGGISSVMGFAGFIVFIFFMRSAALVARDKALASRLVAHLIAWAVYLFGVVVTIILVVVAGFAAVASIASSFSGGGGSAQGAATSLGGFLIFALILAGLMFLAYIGMLSWYAMLCKQTRDTVARYVRKM
jgi:hypothetical protein